MTTREQRLGCPFPGDYPDPRSAEQREREGREVHKQAADLARRSRDVGFRRELLGLLHTRREAVDRAEPFDAVPSRVGFDTLVVSGNLLVHAESLGNAMVQGLIERDGFAPSPVDCLEGRVVRLSHQGVTAMRLDDLARILREHGVPASVNHVTPLGPVAKGLGGPEPSDGARPFPSTVPGSGNPGTGEGGHRTDRVVVATVDTGITAEIRSDHWLANVARDDNVDPLDAYPKGGNGFLDFGAGHGTFAAGIVQQVAPGAEVRVYRALDSDGIGSEVDIACAMVRAAREGASVINLSLGTQTLDDQPLIAVGAALEMIEEETRGGREVLVVAAAGNFASKRPCWPAAFRRVVAVAGLTADGRPSEWSSRGWWVDCSTVAEGVVSTYVQGRESTEIDPDPDTFGSDAWATWTGTSFAAPQIAGGVARLCQEQGLAPRSALRELLRHGTPIPDFGRALEILPGS
ncbi:MAG TPA: S8/S53 family peptidase [Actinomycetes bacterium]